MSIKRIPAEINVSVRRNGKIQIKGNRVVQTIKALIAAGPKGITALEVSSWAYRLATYIYKLRHIYGLNIKTVLEPHEGGEHARYILLDDAQIVEVDDD